MHDLNIQAIKKASVEAILNRLTVQQFFDVVYAQIQLPLICFNTAFQHIAHCYQEPFYFSSWEEIANQGEAGEQNIFQFGYLDFQETIYSAGQATYINTGRSAEHPSVNGAVLRDNELLAYCGIMVEDCIIDDVLAVNNVLCKTIPLLLDNGTTPSNTDNSLSADDEILIRDEIDQTTASKSQRRFPAPYYFATISYRTRGVSTLQYARNYLSKQFDGTISCITKDNILYMLFHSIMTDEAVEQLRKVLEDISLKMELQIAVTCRFFDPAEIPMRRYQASPVLTIGQVSIPNERVFFFRDIYWNILAYAAMRSLPGSIYMPEHFQRLETLPEKIRDSYLVTLYQYLLHFRRASATADALKLHKNTVIYRINKLQTLLDLNFEDDQICDALLFSLTAWSIAEGVSLNVKK